MKHGDVVEAEAILMKRSFISFPNYYEVRHSVHMMNDKGIHFDCLQSSEMPSSMSSNSTKYVIRNIYTRWAKSRYTVYSTAFMVILIY